MDERTRYLLAELAVGRIPKQIPDDCEYSGELKAIYAYYGEVFKFAVNMSKGDLSATLNTASGTMVESLKTLHAKLQRLTWQTKQVAEGDLSQRVDFMGEFSEAFNQMVENLAEARKELLHMSQHDALTGLNNRAYFDTEVERAAKGRRFPVSFIIADLDGLKKVNDCNGHEAGDRLIKAAASVLRESFRGDDIVARIGGDEFAAVLLNCDESAATVAMERVMACQAAHNATNELILSISIGAGTATCKEEIVSALKLADARMYRHKSRHGQSTMSPSNWEPESRRDDTLLPLAT